MPDRGRPCAHWLLAACLAQIGVCACLPERVFLRMGHGFLLSETCKCDGGGRGAVAAGWLLLLAGLLSHVSAGREGGAPAL